MIKKESNSREFLRKKANEIGLIFSLSLIFLIFAIIYNRLEKVALEKVEHARKALDAISNENNVIERKIDYLIQISTNGYWNKFGVHSIIFYTITTILSVLVSGYISNLLQRRNSSYVLITSQSIKDKETKESKEKMKLLKTIGSILLAVMAGILSNYAFIYLTK